MILLLVQSAHVFYWLWVILLGIRWLANYYVFSTRGEDTMEDLSNRWRPDYAAHTLLFFTFYFDEDNTTASNLRNR